MNHPTMLSSIGTVLALGLIAMPAVGQPIETARTPWGDPDLQGVWSYATITPLQRPTELSGRAFLTAEEVAQVRDEAGFVALAHRPGDIAQTLEAARVAMQRAAGVR